MASNDYYGGSGQGGHYPHDPNQQHYGQQGYDAPPQQYGGHSPYPNQVRTSDSRMKAGSSLTCRQTGYPPPNDQYNQYNAPPAHDPYAQQQAPHSYSPAPSYGNQVAPYPHQGDVQARDHSPYPPAQYNAPPHGDAYGGQYGQQGYGQQPPQQYGGGYDANPHGGAPGAGGPEGERGLGATLVGGAGGAFVGHKLGGGALGTVGGLIAGAIGANVLENHHE